MLPLFKTGKLVSKRQTIYSNIDGSLTGKFAQRGQSKKLGFFPGGIAALAINFFDPDLSDAPL
jgi:hypothetical protein